MGTCLKRLPSSCDADVPEDSPGNVCSSSAQSTLDYNQTYQRVSPSDTRCGTPSYPRSTDLPTCFFVPGGPLDRRRTDSASSPERCVYIFAAGAAPGLTWMAS